MTGPADASSGDRYVVRAVARALDILDRLESASGGLSLADPAEAVDPPKSSVFRYLPTLQTRGYVQQDHATGDYRPGLRAIPSHARHLELLRERARPLMEGLRDRFGETIN